MTDGPARVLVEPLERAVLDGVRDLEAEPDRIRVDLGLLPVFADERPLSGLAGLIDWRSDGRLSGLLRSGFFRGEVGEQLLTLGDRRLPFDRLVLFGVGERADFEGEQVKRVADRMVAAAVGLRASGVVIALPSRGIERRIAEDLFEALIAAVEAALRAKPKPEPEPGPEPEPEPATEGPTPDLAPPVSEIPAPAPAVPEPDLPPSVANDDSAGDTAGDTANDTANDTAGDTAGAPAPEPAPIPPPEGGTGAESPLRDPQEDTRATPEPAAFPAPVRWWVVADEQVIARLRRVLSGPPRPARGSGLHT